MVIITEGLAIFLAIPALLLNRLLVISLFPKSDLELLALKFDTLCFPLLRMGPSPSTPSMSSTSPSSYRERAGLPDWDLSTQDLHGPSHVATTHIIHTCTHTTNFLSQIHLTQVFFSKYFFFKIIMINTVYALDIYYPSDITVSPEQLYLKNL